MNSNKMLKVRITEVFGARFHVHLLEGSSRETVEKSAILSGNLKLELEESGTTIAVGDYCEAMPATSGTLESSENAEPLVLKKRLERKTEIKRQKVGSPSGEQVIAANVDIVFVVQSCNQNWNPRRLERLIAGLQPSGCEIIVVASKCELAVERTAYEMDLLTSASGLQTIFHSSETGEGDKEVASLLTKGVTAVLVGSSGVGKSTLVNRLVSGASQQVDGLRKGDEQGKHTTTRRSLFKTKSGAYIIDTPGMRGFGVTEIDASGGAGFQGLEEAARSCRFRQLQPSE